MKDRQTGRRTDRQTINTKQKEGQKQRRRDGLLQRASQGGWEVACSLVPLNMSLFRPSSLLIPLFPNFCQTSLQQQGHPLLLQMNPKSHERGFMWSIFNSTNWQSRRLHIMTSDHVRTQLENYKWPIPSLRHACRESWYLQSSSWTRYLF